MSDNIKENLNKGQEISLEIETEPNYRKIDSDSKTQKETAIKMYSFLFFHNLLLIIFLYIFNKDKKNLLPKNLFIFIGNIIIGALFSALVITNDILKILKILQIFYFI